MTPAVPQQPQPSLLYSAGRTFCRIATTLLFDLHVTGVENVPSTGGVLLLANHQSYLDPVLVGVQLRRPLSFLAKSELFEKPISNWLIRNLNAFPVRQGAGDVGAIRETIRRLEEGHIMTIFPEGTRTPTGQLQALQPGFALVVRKVHVPIVPVAITDSFKAWPIHNRVFRPYPIRVQYGPPLNVEGLKAAEIVKLVERTLGEMLENRAQNSECRVQNEE